MAVTTAATPSTTARNAKKSGSHAPPRLAFGSIRRWSSIAPPAPIRQTRWYAARRGGGESGSRGVGKSGSDGSRSREHEGSRRGHDAPETVIPSEVEGSRRSLLLWTRCLDK